MRWCVVVALAGCGRIGFTSADATGDAAGDAAGPTAAFVAVAGHSAATSGDGFTWSPAAMPSTNPWWNVGFGGGTFVALDTWEEGAAWSSDGLTWSPTTLGFCATGGYNCSWNAIGYGGGTFVAVAESSNVATTTDGRAWTTATMANDYWYSVAYGNGTFVAVSASGDDAVAYSHDGETWLAATLPSIGYRYATAFGAGRFVTVVNGPGSGTSNEVDSSTDGVTWTASTLPAQANWYLAAYGAGQFVATATDVAMVATSTDGITWTGGTLPFVPGCLTYGSAMFVALRSGEGEYSLDGQTWSTFAAPGLIACSSLAARP